MENWSGKYLLNIENIDEQHKGFFELWDNECQHVDLQDKQQLSHVIEKLENYIKEHFVIEEEMLKNSNYSEIENHIAQHRFFIQKVSEMKLELKYMNALLFEKTAVFMKKWFLGHILQSDKKYQEIVTHYLDKDKK